MLERYRLARRLGAGAYGAVWLAYDETLERDVAVKVVPRDPGNEDSPRGGKRTRAEHEALAVALCQLLESNGLEPRPLGPSTGSPARVSSQNNGTAPDSPAGPSITTRFWLIIESAGPLQKS